MIINVVSPAVRGVLSQLDPDKLPEAYNYLASLLDEDGEVSAAPREMASTLTLLDKPKIFPDFVLNFIRGMLELEIGEGNSDAMTDLGSLYYTGSRGIEQNFEKAVRLYKMASERGNRAAQEYLGYCYYYGRETGEPDYERAFRYFSLGAFDGHLVSLYKIGDMYLHGLYVTKNEREAWFIFQHIIQNIKQDSEKRVAGPVFLRLGWMYLNGVGTERDARTAMFCFHRAELYLYDMVMHGDAMYRKSLQSAIEGQLKARERMTAVLPEDTWHFDD